MPETVKRLLILSWLLPTLLIVPGLAWGGGNDPDEEHIFEPQPTLTKPPLVEELKPPDKSAFTAESLGRVFDPDSEPEFKPTPEQIKAWLTPRPVVDLDGLIEFVFDPEPDEVRQYREEVIRQWDHERQMSLARLSTGSVFFRGLNPARGGSGIPEKEPSLESDSWYLGDRTGEGFEPYPGGGGSIHGLPESEASLETDFWYGPRLPDQEERGGGLSAIRFPDPPQVGGWSTPQYQDPPGSIFYETPWQLVDPGWISNRVTRILALQAYVDAQIFNLVDKFWLQIDFTTLPISQQDELFGIMVDGHSYTNNTASRLEVASLYFDGLSEEEQQRFGNEFTEMYEARKAELGLQKYNLLASSAAKK